LADVDALLEALTLEEKALLTAGADPWSLQPIERLGLPRIRVTDGHAGARAPGDLEATGELPWEVWGIVTGRATSVPCGSAVGATWDPNLAEQLGHVVGSDALTAGCRGLLAPTVNLHRAPLAGRNFECYSEDPLLSGKLAAGYIRGVQSHGVFATVKHLVGNEAEFERDSISSVIDERTLRELYLLPFELAVKEGGALAVMTSYNRLNGSWLTEQTELLTGVLREEWGFHGLVMTDWSGVVNAATSLAAGVDLEMPGPGQGLGARVISSIDQGLVDKGDLDAAVRRLLTALDRIGALDAPTIPAQTQEPNQAQRALIRSASAEASVLLKNDGVLPLQLGALRSVAIIGEPARQAATGGGGSAQLVPHRVARPLDALREALGHATVTTYERGCDATRAPARVGGPALPVVDGFTTEVFAGTDFSGPAVIRRRVGNLVFAYLGTFSEGYPEGAWSVRARGTVVPDGTGPRRLVLTATGPARLYLNGELVLDSAAHDAPPVGAGAAWLEDARIAIDVDLTDGVAAELVLEYVHRGGPFALCRVGVREREGDLLMERAVEAARGAEVAVVFVGTDDEWETEGHDRPTFSLPGRQDELVRRVAAANPRTVVVVNAGATVDLPWADEVAAVLHVWFGGEEMDGAIVDVLTGRVDPGGRLPMTIPRRLEHNPSYDNYPGENGEVRYGEGLFMGYRGYEHRAIEPRFAFGHGLSYTTFELGEPQVSSNAFRSGEQLSLRVPVTNTGTRDGSEVVQCYVAPRSPRLARPLKELKGFAKLRLAPGESGTAELVLDDRCFAYWDNGHPDWEAVKERVQSTVQVPGSAGGSTRGWRVDPGEYEVLIGTASDRIQSRITITVES
jgi:beta-glucosidase